MIAAYAIASAPTQNPRVMRLMGGKGILALRMAGYTKRSSSGTKKMMEMGSKFCMRSLGMP
jgi:hypothetical protein